MNSDPVLIGIVLSDSVIREAVTNKLSLIGCFHTFTVPRLPFITPLFFVTVTLANFKGKMPQPKMVTVRIEDSTSSVILGNAAGQIGAQPEYDFTGVEVIEFPFVFMPFQIYHPGRYIIDVLVDGEKVGHRDLMVFSITAQIPPPQTPNPPQ